MLVKERSKTKETNKPILHPATITEVAGKGILHE